MVVAQISVANSFLNQELKFWLSDTKLLNNFLPDTKHFSKVTVPPKLYFIAQGIFEPNKYFALTKSSMSDTKMATLAQIA